jgi:hypothetical protein
MAMPVNFTPYTAVFLAMTIAYVFSMYSSHALLRKINTEGEPRYWPFSNRKKLEVTRQISTSSADGKLRSLAKQYVMYIKLSSYVLYIGVGLFMLMPALGV